MIAFGSIVVGVLFAAGLYLLMSSNVQRVAIGFILLSNGVNMLVLVATGVPEGASAPLVGEGAPGPNADPLPQAFVLTAIVIGLGMSAFLLAMAGRTHRETGSDDLSDEAGP